MQGVIHNYRRGRHNQTTNQVIVYPEGVSGKEAAAKLVGKKVTWHTGKKDLPGEVTGAHGNSGAVRVRFETGIPGQALGTIVTIQ